MGLEFPDKIIQILLITGIKDILSLINCTFYFSTDIDLFGNIEGHMSDAL